MWLFSTQPSLAWDFSSSGHIVSLYHANPGNAWGVIVAIDGTITGCNGVGAPNTAYLAQSGSNYQQYLSAIMSAYYSGKVVVLLGSKDNQGFCQIVDFYVGNK